MGLGKENAITTSTLKDKVVLIAGGAKNLGGLLARNVAAQGAKGVVVHHYTTATEAKVAVVRAAGTEAPVEHFTRAASKEFGERGISVTAIGPGPMDTPFFYGQKTPKAQACHKSAAALSRFSGTRLTDIGDIAPWIRFLVTEGWWMNGQTILVNGGYATKYRRS